MGYRSDVAAALYVHDEKHLPALKLWVDENFPMKLFDKDVRWFEKGIVLELESVKWYDDFEDVKAFIAAADKFLELVNNETSEEDTPNFNYEFIRIGEDYDDIQVQYEGFNCACLLEVSRGITIDC